MPLFDDIDRATRYVLKQNAEKEYTEERMEDSVLSKIVQNVFEKFCRHDFDFSKLETLVLSQNGKKRLIKSYEEKQFVEQILCYCVKRILDRVSKVRYPNRNKICRSIFNILPAVVKMQDFVIARFDFKDFFNSVNSRYVFEEYIKKRLTDRQELELIENYVTQTNFAYAGLRPSNAIAEIAAREFDQKLKLRMDDKGLIFYERYIDDGLMILNQFVSEEELKRTLNSVISEVFGNTKNNVRNHVKLNQSKFNYVSARDDFSQKDVAFLGYKFIFQKATSQKIQVCYGISDEKKEKYSKKIKKFIRAYQSSKIPDEKNNSVLLRHRILNFARRQVYLAKHYNGLIWKVKGFISNYGELRYLLDDRQHIEQSTIKFLENAIIDAFNDCGCKVPPYLKGNKKYQLLESMKRNRTMLFVEEIGHSRTGLVKLCKEIGIEASCKGGELKSYDRLVKEYLVKVKVGF